MGVRGYFTERPSAGFVDLDLGVASRRWLTDREVANVDLVPVVTPYVGFRLVSRGRQRSFSID